MSKINVDYQGFSNITSQKCHSVIDHLPCWYNKNFEIWKFECLVNNLFRLTSKKHKILHYWPIVRGIHWWPMDSPHKGPVTRETFPYHDIMMNMPAASPSEGIFEKFCKLVKILIWEFLYSSCLTGLCGKTAIGPHRNSMIRNFVWTKRKLTFCTCISSIRWLCRSAGENRFVSTHTATCQIFEENMKVFPICWSIILI